MGKNLRRRAVKGDVPVMKDDEAVGDARGIVHAVRDEQDGRAGLAPVGRDVFEHAAAACGIEACGGLVKNEHLGTHGDNAGDGDAALLPAGELERRALKQRLVDATKRAASRTRASTSSAERRAFFGPKAMSRYTVSSKSWCSGY